MDIGSFFILLVIGSSLWVTFDSHSLGAKKGALGGGFFDVGPATWLFACLMFWILAFPGYLATRPRYVALARGGKS
ncbi:MAG: hypothetical protein FJ096_04320 [Deltaproteobacteria bacterium]|nr:hypothetical protein [Deltaproteobacteria bacterium]